MIDSVQDNLNNKGGKCANVGCGFQFTKIIAKANYYDTLRQSWVCGTCAQTINRYWLGLSNQHKAVYKQRCISSEDALFNTLKNG